MLLRGTPAPQLPFCAGGVLPSGPRNSGLKRRSLRARKHSARMYVRMYACMCYNNALTLAFMKLSLNFIKLEYEKCEEREETA